MSLNITTTGLVSQQKYNYRVLTQFFVHENGRILMCSTTIRWLAENDSIAQLGNPYLESDIKSQATRYTTLSNWSLYYAARIGQVAHLVGMTLWDCCTVPSLNEPTTNPNSGRVRWILNMWFWIRLRWTNRLIKWRQAETGNETRSCNGFHRYYVSLV